MSLDVRVAERLRALPKIDELLRRPELATLPDSEAPRWALAQAARALVEARRKAILAGEDAGTEVTCEDVARAARALARPSLRPIVNATGVVLHTNFGRAPLAEEAVARVAAVARGYSNLEYDEAARERGSRHAHVRAALAQLTGAEDALVVNNGAAAVLVALAGLAAGREVVVSRGELVEIGGGFRIPDVMRQSGARLVEVGTTNKTHGRDVEDALGAETGLLLKVHRSNFAMIGFVAEVTLAELVALGRAHAPPVPVMIDLGSGALVDLASATAGALPGEPTVAQAVAAGADLVCFSGDKLLGGPQAGLLVGRAEAIARVAKHPLMRALRPDKLTLAALEGTLAIYRRGEAAAVAHVPALRMLAAPVATLRARAERLLAAIASPAGSPLAVTLQATTSAVGGGALPLAEPPSFALALVAADGRSAEALDAALRAHDPAVVGRIAEACLLLDVRTIADDEVAIVAAAVRKLQRSPA
jgi:L-seryl-tRNA(Ser) seleniumtransferase